MDAPAGAPVTDTISYQLGHISGQLTALQASVQQAHQDLTKRIDAAEADISDLKQSRARALGWATGIATAISAGFSAVLAYVFR